MGEGCYGYACSLMFDCARVAYLSNHGFQVVFGSSEISCPPPHLMREAHALLPLPHGIAGLWQLSFLRQVCWLVA
ncbi:hypothetical protein Pyn_16782 [Prunus yedoensis var. nudiflora]|uniref:Uncharacterized protein n=1 Tax=Prunus yedoensis var. nudiflora TaxID=2094558 RepID=A0A314Y2F3_PRUYE|nr:hypothetical protein Pyn_16782 [Prunus yedoensis var. nudiflora]